MDRGDAAAPRRRCDRLKSLDAEERDEFLGHLIEDEIVPRLLVSHGEGRPNGRSAAADQSKQCIALSEADVFAPLVIERDADELLGHVEGFLDAGASPEAVFVELLAPTARRLGEYWEEDRCDFVDVTMGLWRLQEVMREVALAYPAPAQRDPHRRSALFTPMPGDQHSFGALMVEEIFARAGWDSEALIEPQRSQLLDLVATRGFDLVGLTVTGDCPSGDVARLVQAIRSVSKRPEVKIILGGRAVIADRSLVESVRADGTADDAPGALALADSLCSAREYSSSLRQ